LKRSTRINGAGGYNFTWSLLAEGFIPALTQRIANPETADDFGHKMINTLKIVFSKHWMV